MKKIITIVILLVSVLCKAQTIESTQKGYHKTHPDINSDVFNFNPDKLGIVQGVVAKDVALRNTRIWNEVIRGLPKDVRIVEIDTMDAFFEVAEYNHKSNRNNALYALRLRSNLTLKMSDNTFIRVQPNGAFAFHLLSVFEIENVNITGGNLIGDRYEHDYTARFDANRRSRRTHEWGYCLSVTSSKNVTIDNVNILQSSGDGININASHIRHSNGTPNKAVVSENIVIQNCLITESRRNNISVVDGKDIEIIKNTITKAGLGKGKGIGSWGIDPRCGIDLEAYNESGPNGKIYEYEKVENVTIKGNTFVSNRKVDIIGFIASKILIEDNDLQKSIVLQYASEAKIYNNRMISTADEDGNTASSGISTSNSRRVHDIEIYDNTLTGFKNSLVLSGTKIKAYNNVSTGFKAGLVIGVLADSEIYNNRFITRLPKAVGLRSVNGESRGLVRLYKNTFKVTHKPITMRGYNLTSTGSLLIEDSTFNCSASNSGFNLSLSGCKNIEFKNISSNREFKVLDSENIKY